MSQIGSADPLSLSSIAPQSRRENAYGELATDEFMDIMLSELQNQNPLEPNDTQAMLEQLSSIRSIESDIELTDKLESIATQGQLTEASSMIGMFVTGVDVNNERALDFVVSASRTQEGVLLNLQSGQRVSLENVDEVIDGDDAQSLLEDLLGSGSSEDDESNEGAGA